MAATGRTETVRSFGWYLRKYIADARAKGATPILCSLVPRNNWKDGRVIRSTDDYVAWTRAVAESAGVPLIDLNDAVALLLREGRRGPGVAGTTSTPIARTPRRRARS